MDRTKHMDFETVLVDVYGNGAFHIILLILCSMTGFVTALEIQTMIFMNYVPAFQCANEILSSNASVTWITRDEFDIANSRRENGISDLRQYQSSNVPQCWGLVTNSSDNNTFPFDCVKWKFDHTEMINTVVTQFNLVCGNSHWVPIMDSIYLLFNAVGYILAFSSDRFGRRIPFIFFTIWGIVISVATPFVKSLPLLVFLRGCRGMSVALTYLGITILSELVPMNKRAAFGNAYWIAWSFGYMTTAGIAYLVKDWILLRLWSCLFLLFYLTYPFIVCESPRWLCVHGRHAEAALILQRIARWNKAKLPADYFEHVDCFLKNAAVKMGQVDTESEKEHNKSFSKTDSVLDMLRDRTLRIRTLVCCYVHTAVVTVYFGIIIDGIFASDNMFLNVFLMGLSELPSSFIGWAMSANLGRRLSGTILLLLTTAAIIGAKSFETPLPIFKTTCALCIKLFLTTAYCVLDIHVPELYPTTIRSAGFFTVVMVASILSSVAPFVNSLSKIYIYIPAIIHGILCFTSAILVQFCLPETRNCPLAQTVEDSKNFVRGREQQWSENMHRRYENVLHDANFSVMK